MISTRGEIRRGIMIPVNTASFDKATGGTVTYVLADPALYDIRSVDTIYDSDGNIIDASPTLDAGNEVDVTIPADADLDLGEFSWKGEGFDIAGAYNGLDIMKAVFADQAELAYLSSTFDTVQWDAQTAVQTASLRADRRTDGIAGDLGAKLEGACRGDRGAGNRIATGHR